MIFTDIMIHKNGNKIWTHIYSKPTYSKQYVPFNSSKPKDCLKNIPFCLVRRICTIVENSYIKKSAIRKIRHFVNLSRNKESVDNSFGGSTL